MDAATTLAPGKTCVALAATLGGDRPEDPLGAEREVVRDLVEL